ncbi:MAG: precorrin-8X methylmutase [Synergistaceae bacterium]|jgi:precorrin-8X/cobalt-precorrin-8 methylmutase|nr:precorrin-8X methylmutase [Synergistaceae bacterium]
MRPEAIEQASMAIIAKELGEHAIPGERLPIVMRVIHATADFDFARTLAFSEDAVRAGQEALLRGVTVVTDTQMAASGVNKKLMSANGGSVRCYMAGEDVAAEAEARGVTRAVVSMEHAARDVPDAIFAIGNAPTALLRLCELVAEGTARPSLVIGVPVGFVNVVESKEVLMRTGVPWIAAVGRKGGSPAAAAIVNALLLSMQKK